MLRQARRKTRRVRSLRLFDELDATELCSIRRDCDRLDRQNGHDKRFSPKQTAADGIRMYHTKAPQHHPTSETPARSSMNRSGSIPAMPSWDRSTERFPSLQLDLQDAMRRPVMHVLLRLQFKPSSPGFKVCPTLCVLPSTTDK